MKFILLPLLILSLNVQANENYSCQMPVKRHHAKKKVQAKQPCCKTVVQVVVAKETPKEVQVVKRYYYVSKPQKNHLRVYGGIGPGGYSKQDANNAIILTQTYGFVMAIGYGRNISEHWSLEGVAVTNGTGLLGAGYNW